MYCMILYCTLGTKKFTTVINKYIREMRDRTSRYKYIGNTLRMTVHG